MKLSPPIAFSLALIAAVGTVLFVDPLDSTTLSTPFCLGIILMWLSLRQTGWYVLALSVGFCLLDFYATKIFLGKTPEHVQYPHFWFCQQFGLFLLLCTMAIYWSASREESEKNLKHIQTILGKLPAPVVISDATGYILYVNEALCVFLRKTSTELVGKRYLDLFMAHIEEGKAMRYYIELFENPDEIASEIELRHPVNPTGVKASLTCMGTGAQRSMITVLQLPRNNTPAL